MSFFSLTARAEASYPPMLTENFFNHKTGVSSSSLGDVNSLLTAKVKSVSASQRPALVLICTDNLTTLLEKKCYSCILRPHRSPPSSTQNPPSNEKRGISQGVWRSYFVPSPSPSLPSPRSRSSSWRGLRAPQFWHEMPKERESFSSPRQLAVLLFHMVKCLLRVRIHTECKKKTCPSLASVLASLHFPSEKVLPFCVLIYQQGASLFAQQSTIITRNRNFSSMVLIKYPHL